MCKNYDKKEINSRLNVHLDPSSGIIRIESSDKIEAVHVYNISGKLIYSRASRNEVDIYGYGAGIYFVKVQTANRQLVRKVVLNK
ncbi:MAG: T9SS type A sorting domain-containing protein [Bacteroidetes bacterium]|nr:T9SS type A sorting domain-containing protein [Bacteroidota bacterium]